MKAFITEVELNKNNLQINDTLNYVDCFNSETYKIIDLDDTHDSFMATNGSDIVSYFFSELQFGWSLTSKTKKRFYQENINLI